VVLRRAENSTARALVPGRLASSVSCAVALRELRRRRTRRSRTTRSSR
jgi:hypothetical protein